MDKEMTKFYKTALLGNVSGEPLCDEYRDLWRACGDDRGRLVALAVRQQSLPYLLTHCYKGKGVSKDYIKREFADYINGRYEVKDADLVKGYTYALNVDLEEDSVVTANVSAYMWCRDVELTVRETKAPILYIGCGSTIHLTLGGYNNVMIYLFDDSKVIIDDADEVSKVIVYKFSDKASVEKGRFCFAQVKEHNKTLRL